MKWNDADQRRRVDDDDGDDEDSVEEAERVVQSTPTKHDSAVLAAAAAAADGTRPGARLPAARCSAVQASSLPAEGTCHAHRSLPLRSPPFPLARNSAGLGWRRVPDHKIDSRPQQQQPSATAVLLLNHKVVRRCWMLVDRPSATL